MTDLEPPAPSASRSTDSWTQAWLTFPPRQNRARAILIIAGIVVALGTVDYFAGIWFSLQLFYLIPVVLSVAWLGWKEGCVTAATCVVVRLTGDLAAGILLHVGLVAILWNRLADVCISFTLVGVFHALISLQRQLEERVRRRTAALEQAGRLREQLERELLEIAARERNAMGRELHDDLCQHLVGTALATKVLAEHLADRDAASARDAQSIVNHVEEGIAKTRSLARGLLLASIEPSDLPGELAQLAIKGSETGVTCRFRMEGQPVIPSAASAAQLLRIAQEALRNALRHSDPGQVDLVLGGNAESTFLMIHDDGCGLAPNGSGTGMGLKIMEHRASLAGGTLTIIPAPGEGTRVICQIPPLTNPAFP